MAVIGYVAHRSVGQLRDAIDSVEHTHQVLTKLDALDSGLTDAQNQLRGFALTGAARDLAKYTATVSVFATELQTIRQLTAGDLEQQQRIRALENAYQRYVAITGQAIDALHNHEFDAARRLISGEEGEQLQIPIRKAIVEMRSAEQQRLIEGRNRAHTNATMMDLVIGAGFVIAVSVIGVASFALRRDLSGRRRAEDELERFFRLSLDFLAIAGPDGYFKRVSHGITDILGWTPEEFVSRPYIELVHPDDRQRTLAEVARQLERGEKVVHFENRYRHKDGSWRVLSWRSVPHEGMMYGAARDMTESHRVDAEIRRLNADLKERADELETFSYSVSHDLRAPLRHIQGYAEMLNRELEGKIKGDAPRFLGTIISSAQKMNELIEQLLSFSQMGRMGLQSGVIDVADLLAEVRQELEMATRDRNIHWTIAEIPLVQGDRAMIKQVFANLLGNAVKYTRSRDAAEIEVGEVGEEHGRVILFVRDNGIGFDMRHAEKLFGVFQRLHRATEFEGSGIGLANAHRIITRHGGRIWADARPDEGATFYFTLQRAVAT